MSGQGSEAFRQRRQFLNSLLALPAFAVGAATVGYGGMLPAAGESDLRLAHSILDEKLVLVTVGLCYL